VPATRLKGSLDVIANGAEVCEFTVAVTVMSPGEELKAEAELLTVVDEPVAVERLILFAPAVTLHVVEEPPLEVSWIEVA
jgi:hypothetical protein